MPTLGTNIQSRNDGYVGGFGTATFYWIGGGTALGSGHSFIQQQLEGLWCPN